MLQLTSVHRGIEGFLQFNQTFLGCEILNLIQLLHV